MFISGLEMDSSMELLSVQVSQCFRLLEYKSGYSKYLARCSFSHPPIFPICLLLLCLFIYCNEEKSVLF